MDVISPEKLINSDGINRDRYEEKYGFHFRPSTRAIAHEQQEHPRQQDHCVTVGKLPAAGISVTPKGEG